MTPFLRLRAAALFGGLLASLLTGLLAPAARAQAPAYEWATACGSGPAPYAWGPTRLVVDGRGNTYVAGTFNDTTLVGNTLLMAVPSTAGAYVGDAFVAKLDAQGRVLWATRAGGNNLDLIQGLALDAAGNAYVTGSFQSFSIGFGPAGGGGPVLYNASQYTDAFVAKLDGATGQWLWARRAGGVWGDEGGGIAVNAAGEVYVAGTFTDVADFGPTTLTSTGRAGDLFIAKLSSSGAWLWVRQAGGAAVEVANALLVDNAGMLYLRGYFYYPARSSTSTTLGTTTLQATGIPGSSRFGHPSDLFVGKLDGAGNWLWAVQGDAVNGQNWVFNEGTLSTDNAGGLYLAGMYASQSVRLGSFVLPNLSAMNPPLVPGPSIPYTNNYATDVFAAKIDATTGTWQWAARAGDAQEDYVSAIAVDPRGAVYLAAPYYSCNCRGFANPLTGTGPRTHLAQLGATTGRWNWAAVTTGARTLTADAAGRLYAGDFFGGPTATFGTTTLAAAGPRSTTGYVARLAAGVLPTRPAVVPAEGLSVWPNPAAAGRALWVQGAGAGQRVVVFDALGRRMAEGAVPATGPLRLELPAGLAPGLYVVRGSRQSRRVVIE